MATQSTRGSSPSAVVAPALTRVMLVDDHGILRVGARTLLESTGQFVVCGEADTGASAVEVGTREAPDLIVADLGLPDGGVALIRKLAQLPCHPKVIVLSMYEASLYAQRSFARPFRRNRHRLRAASFSVTAGPTARRARAIIWRSSRT